MSLYPSMVILTGAGVSAESGIKTFRDSDGLWEGHRIEDVATPEAFERSPQLVNAFYNLRRSQLRQVEPNLAHLALANLESIWPGSFLLVTQNVDNLHERAGSKSLIHMHGELESVLCNQCGLRWRWTNDLHTSDRCLSCKAPRLRPDIVWFGEIPYSMDVIGETLVEADIFVAIGTSGVVYPAAGFVELAVKAEKIEVNLNSSEVGSLFDRKMLGQATVQVPLLLDELTSKYVS